MITFQPSTTTLFVILIAIIVAMICIFNSIKTRKEHYDSSVLTWIRRFFITVIIILISLNPSISNSVENKSISDLIVLFVVDNSGSMSAIEQTDDPSNNSDDSNIVTDDANSNESKINSTITRLDEVKSDIKLLAENLPPVKYAAITFNSIAVSSSPISTDIRVINQFADSLYPEITDYSNGTDFSSPIQTINNQIQNYKEIYSKNRIMLYYFSDGDTTSSKTEEDFSQYTQLKNQFSGGCIIGYGTSQPQIMKKFSPNLSGLNNLLKSSNMNTTNLIEYSDSYITDPTTSQNATSFLHSDNLKTIANNIGLNYTQRLNSEQIKMMAQNVFIKNWSFTPTYEKSEIKLTYVFPLCIILALLIIIEFLIFYSTTLYKGLKK